MSVSATVIPEPVVCETCGADCVCAEMRNLKEFQYRMLLKVGVGVEFIDGKLVLEKKPRKTRSARKTRSDKGKPRMKKAEKLKYTCECCGAFDKEEVGIAIGFNDVEMRVCGNCDTDGCDYNGWGGYYEDYFIKM